MSREEFSIAEKLRTGTSQMTRMWLTGLIVLSALLLPAAGPAEGEETCGRMVMVLLDGSGSFTKDLPAAIQHAKRLLLDLGPGDCFVARAIRERSYGAANDIVPLLRLPMARRTIDAGRQRQILLLKRAAAAGLDGMLGQKPASATDLWQALYAASLTFRSVEARERELHIMSDLEDNRRLRPRNLPLRFDDARVRMVVPRGDRDTPEAFEGRIEAWRLAFTEAGAAGVAFAELPRARQAASTAGGTR